MVSTGRGGAGNIVSAESVGHDNVPQLEGKQESKKVLYSTGRGGAGNFKTSDEIPSPKLVPQGSNTPALTTSKFTTGRGGYGNMVSNDDPELSRKLQDVDGTKEEKLQSVTSNRSFSVGRGGFGNVISNTSKGSSNESGNNLYTVVSAGEKKARGHKKKGLMEKVKGLFS